MKTKPWIICLMSGFTIMRPTDKETCTVQYVQYTRRYSTVRTIHTHQTVQYTQYAYTRLYSTVQYTHTRLYSTHNTYTLDCTVQYTQYTRLYSTDIHTSLSVTLQEVTLTYFLVFDKELQSNSGIHLHRKVLIIE